MSYAYQPGLDGLRVVPVVAPQSAHAATSRKSCSGFCSDRTNSWRHPHTARYNRVTDLSSCFSVGVLKRNFFRVLARLVRDQEVDGSNPFAPTIFLP
jgi:hypothetical protein